MSSGISRRDFLKSTGAALTGAALPDAGALAADSPAVAASAAPVAGRVGTDGDQAQASGAAPREIVLNVNGRARPVAVEPRTTLAEVLRGPLGLTGTKIGCDRGACSACTVWLDRMPVLACMLLAVDVGGREVVTIEGLGRGEALHPVQEAFIAHDAIQCGFCTPGLAMSCAALVESGRGVTADDVKSAIAGHLCRCGTYPHVVAATLDAARAGKG